MAAAPAVRTQPGGSRRQAMRCGAARQLVCAGVLQHLQRYTRGTRPRLSSRCLGYVGEGTRPAGEYHCRDFEWHEQVGAGQAAVQRQQLELQLQQQQRAAAGLEAAGTGERGGELAAMHSASAEHGPRGATASESGSGCSDDSWERFHAQHSQARFFKEKRYLMLEFPALAVAHPPQHIAEIGCGCGSALLPVLKANPSCRVTGCDISATALRLFHLAAQQAGVQPHRIRTFTLDAASSTADSSGKVTADSSADSSCDSTASIAGGTSGSVTSSAEPAVPDSAGGCSPLAGLGADSLLLVFTLSALPPAAHAAALTHAYAALRPGGLLLFRDYGLYDGAQLRFPGAQMLGPNLYRRSEGTLAYFFSTEALRAAATAVGFQEVECEYARVEMRNRKSGAAMRRVFVHGVFCKPL